MNQLTNESWQKSVNGVLALKAGTRMDGKIASERTKTITREVVYASFRRLYALGYRIQNAENLKEKHLKLLVKDWWHTQKKQVKTIQNDLSRLRCFCKMMGKPGLVRPLNYYLPEIDPKFLCVHKKEIDSHSWAAKGLNMPEVFRKVDKKDLRWV